MSARRGPPVAECVRTVLQLCVRVSTWPVDDFEARKVDEGVANTAEYSLMGELSVELSPEVELTRQQPNYGV